MIDLHRLFSAADLEAIRKATAEAEARTSGEIVPVVVASCSDTGEAVWKLVCFSALFAALAAALASLQWAFWTDHLAWWIALPPLAGAALGFLLARIFPSLLRHLMAEDDRERAVMARARQAFLEEEVFATRERTGILIFLALFERRAVVMGDEGINRAVAQEEWQEIVDALSEGIGSGRAAEALIRAIGDCGRILETHGVEIRPDDTNELADGLRMEDH